MTDGDRVVVIAEPERSFRRCQSNRDCGDCIGCAPEDVER